MGRRLYVGNLPYTTGEAELQELFSKAGNVESVRVMRDAATGRARGFAFVEMATDEEAQKAATEFNQYQMGGRSADGQRSAAQARRRLWRRRRRLRRQSRRRRRRRRTARAAVVTPQRVRVGAAWGSILLWSACALSAVDLRQARVARASARVLRGARVTGGGRSERVSRSGV